MTRPSRRLLRSARETIAAYTRTYEDGITAAIFAVALVVLLGMVALGVDGGRIYDERRQAQNAADHAAIAAAAASCDAGAVADIAAAIAKGQASALLNGYQTDADSTVVIAHEGAVDIHRFTATVDTTISTTFAQVIGFATLDTSAFARAEATGCDATGGGPAAIHAGGTDCPGGSSLHNVEISGNDHTVTGLTRSNGSFENHGGPSTFTNSGPSVVYAGSFEGKLSAGNTYTEAESNEGVSDPQWPAGFAPGATFNTAMDAYRANRKPGIPLDEDKFDITSDGIYYTERLDGVEVESITGNWKFVIVSRFGPIKMSKDHAGMYAAYPFNPANTPANVIAVSGFVPTDGKKCDSFAFERSGRGGEFTGLFWTPNAMSRWGGNEGTINGGFVTWAFQMNGNDHRINGGTGNPAANPLVLLLN